MPTVEANGTTLHYVEQGEGEPVVLVHGTLGDYRSWELQMEPFAERYRTISYSRRYHHPNRCVGDETDYSAALHADDLAALLDGLGLESAHVVGNSYGAYTALFLASRHPERVRSMVLGEPPVLPLLDDDEEGQPLRADFLAKVWEPAAEVLDEGRMEEGVRLFVDGAVADGAYDSFPAPVQELIMDNACELKAETASPEFWTDVNCAEVAEVDTPALVMTGVDSRRMFQVIADHLSRCLPDAELVTLPETTHELTSDNPDAYNETVLRFLDRVGG